MFLTRKSNAEPKPLSEEQLHKLAARVTKAIKRGETETLRTLLATPGINVNLQTHSDYSSYYAMDQVCCTHPNYYKQCFPEMLVMLLEAGGVIRPNAFVMASDYGYADIVRILLPLVDVNEASVESGNTALHAAARNGHGNVVEMLIEAGANPDIKNSHMDTAADCAQKKEHSRIYQYLRSLTSFVGNEADNEWKLTGEREISHVSDKKELGLVLTEVFNFDTKSYLNIVFNTNANVQSQTMKSFSELDETNLVKEAAEHLAQHLKQPVTQLLLSPGSKQRYKGAE